MGFLDYFKRDQPDGDVAASNGRESPGVATMPDITATMVNPEHDRQYTDAITRAILDQAKGEATGIAAAQEIAAGVIGRAFASATASGPGSRFADPDNLFTIARDMVLDGASAWHTDGATIRRAESYQMDNQGRNPTVTVDGQQRAGGIILVRYIIDGATGRGISPLGSAGTLSQMITRLETALNQEASASPGYLLPVPHTSSLDDLAADIAGLKGRIALVETAQAGYGQGASQGTRADYNLQRIGINVPDGVNAMHDRLTRYVLGVYGVPLSLVEQHDGTSQREAWRLFLHGTLTPMAAKVEAAFTRAGYTINLSFDRLFASDIAGRARAFGSLVQGGMDIEEAAAITGILADDEG